MGWLSLASRTDFRRPAWPRTSFLSNSPFAISDQNWKSQTSNIQIGKAPDPNSKIRPDWKDQGCKLEKEGSSDFPACPLFWKCQEQLQKQRWLVGPREAWEPRPKGIHFTSVKERSGNIPNKGRVNPTESWIKGVQFDKANLCVWTWGLCPQRSAKRVYITGLCIVPDKRE